MSKKSFQNSPALAFIKLVKHKHDEQEVKQEDSQVEQEATQVEQKTTQSSMHTQIRTQGRKGNKKPRINLAFDSEDFLDQIRICATNEGKSITQFVNDAVYHYMEYVCKPL